MTGVDAKRPISEGKRIPRRPANGPQRRGTTAEGIVAALRCLDARLSAAADAIKVLFGPESTRDMFRGLHIKPGDVDRSLGQAPVAPLLGPLGFRGPVLAAEFRGERFDRLRELFDLSPFDLDVLLVALAPEIDARYERIFAFIQDDVTRKRPTVDLVLNLLCVDVAEKLERLGRFSVDAPPVGQGLLRVLPPDGHSDGLRLGAALRLDEAVLGYLLGHAAMDSRLAGCCRVLDGPGASRTSSRRPAEDAPAVVYVRAGDLEESSATVRRHAGGRSILALDVERALWSGGDWDGLLAPVFRSALLRDQAILIHRADLLLEGEHAAKLGQLFGRVASYREDVYLDGLARWEPALRSAGAVIELEPCALSPEQSAAAWAQAVERQGGQAAPALTARLATTFPSLHAGQIAAAVLHAVRHSDGAPDEGPATDTLLEGARAQTRGALRGLAERVSIRPSWDELVLPQDTLLQLREIALRVTRRAVVMDDWGFAGRRTHGRGTTVLLSGSSGTGKTFAAAVLAAEIGQDLYRIDLASVVSKYIGETEKKLAQVFDGAERANCVLLFDEADALFGKRSEVRDAHDRYANQEVAYLLQRVERFGGLAILTTNLSGAVDDAFSRRLGATVFFDLPDLAARRQLWERALPAAAPRAGDLDLALLAREVRVSGGVIAKAALAAAFLAADEETPIAMRHLLRALHSEVSSLGIAVPALLATRPS